MACFELRSTDTTSRRRSWVFGVLPAASRISSASMLTLRPSTRYVTRLCCATRSAAINSALNAKRTPSPSRISNSRCANTGSVRGPIDDPRCRIVTRVPKRANNWPNSKPTGPAPITINEAGRCVLEGLDVRPEADVAQPGHGRNGCCGSRRNHDVRGREGASVDIDAVGPRKPRPTFDERQVLQTPKNGGIFLFSELLDERQFVSDDGGHIEATDAQFQTRNAVMGRGVEYFRRPQEPLRRHAADVHTRAAQRQTSVHERGLRAEVVSLDGGAEPSGAAADDDEVVLRHDDLPFGSTSARASPVRF